MRLRHLPLVIGLAAGLFSDASARIAETVGVTGVQGVLTNPGFEAGATAGWQEWHPAGQSAAVGVDGAQPHAGKDKLKRTISRYELSKKARGEIVKKLISEVERKPDRLIATEKKRLKNTVGKKLRGQQKQTKLIEVGD